MFRRTVVLAVMGIISSVALANGASFRGIGPISVQAVSADGTVVVGGNARWTEATGIVDLGGQEFDTLHDVSADGSVIVGVSWGTGTSEAFRWTEATGKVGLGDLPGGNFMSWAFGVSADGSIIVGLADDGTIRPVRWTEPNQIMVLWNNYGHAMDVSADGMVIVGYAVCPKPEPPFDWFLQVFRWTETTGLIGLGGGNCTGWGSPAAVSENGNIVVGQCVDANGNEAFRWTQETGMVGIGDLPGGAFNSVAHDVSGDGSVVVGQGTSNRGTEAFIWDANNGMASLKDLLESSYGLDLNGWTLTEATGITPDGRTIVGYGQDPNGFSPQGWIVSLSEPKTLTMLVEPNNVGINTVSPGIGQHIYHSLWPVVLNAGVYTTCPSVYRFDHWVGNVSDPNAATTTVVMNEDKTVTAVYYADAKKCGDECHPILKGDLNEDCYINFEDFAIYCANWLSCTHPDCD